MCRSRHAAVLLPLKTESLLCHRQSKLHFLPTALHLCQTMDLHLPKSFFIILALAALSVFSSSSSATSDTHPSLSRMVPRYLNPSLTFGFYKQSCPQLDKIVEERVAYWSSLDDTTPAPLLRLFFHDCFVYGCDASVLLNSSKKAQAEKDADINFSLSNFFVIDDIKERLESECSGIVSCADILALAAVYSIKQAGGPFYEIELGRRDSLTSFADSSEVYLPNFNLTVDGLLELFEYVGLDLVDLVALTGAHTIGQGHCKSIANRIFPTVDTQYHHGYGQELKANCTLNGALKNGAYDTDVQYFMDPITSVIFDNAYFKGLLQGYGAFTSDVALVDDKRTRPLVELFASDEQAFFRQFGQSLRKMGKIHVLSGTQGEVRKQCWVRNSNNADFAFNPDPLLPSS